MARVRGLWPAEAAPRWMRDSRCQRALWLPTAFCLSGCPPPHSVPLRRIRGEAQTVFKYHLLATWEVVFACNSRYSELRQVDRKLVTSLGY